MFELVDSINDSPVIKLVGVGGGGSNAVQHMVQSGIEGVDFICCVAACPVRFNSYATVS